jgi:AraC family transcriptional regulator
VTVGSAIVLIVPSSNPVKDRTADVRHTAIVDRRGLAAWQLQRARDYINVNLAHDPSIAEIAHECGLSSSYFARAFKRSTGVPPYKWLTKMRVERAKELLKDPRCELADIAQLCGFVDQSHFTRVFSRSEGYSPGRWRRLHRL